MRPRQHDGAIPLRRCAIANLRQGTIDLSDGRTLGYAEWGPPEATRIIYCHGSPGCRLEIEAPSRALERSGLEVRITAFDRPGYGRSTYRRHRGFLDWSRDLEEAADRLGIGSFALLGASGGSPYAMASAIALTDRVTQLGVVAGSGPPGATGMDRSALMRHTSRSLAIRRVQYAAIRSAFRFGRGDGVVDKSLAMLSEADGLAMKQPDVRRWFRRVFAEALAQGGRAAAAEAAAYWTEWDFDPREVPLDTWLWYGSLDENVPADVGRWLHREIPRSHLTIWPQHGHFTWAFSDECRSVVARLANLEAGRPRCLAINAG